MLSAGQRLSEAYLSRPSICPFSSLARAFTGTPKAHPGPARSLVDRVSVTGEYRTVLDQMNANEPEDGYNHALLNQLADMTQW